MKLQPQDYTVIAAGAFGAVWAVSSLVSFFGGAAETTYHQNADGEIVATEAFDGVVQSQENLGHNSGVKIYTDRNGNLLCAIGNEPCAVTPPEPRNAGPGL